MSDPLVISKKTPVLTAVIANKDLDNWQTVLADAVTDIQELCSILHLPLEDMLRRQPALRQFPLRVPRGFVARMRKGDPADPLLLQVMPQASETISAPGYSSDPLQEAKFQPVRGVMHKYHGRVLLMVAGGCAINCRYCFRRHFPYAESVPAQRDLQLAFDYIKQNKSIREVILSGGDPLMLKNSAINSIVRQLEVIPHVKILRIHTRMPVVLPERVDSELIKILQSWQVAAQRKVVCVLHSNHANELDESVAQACARMRSVDFNSKKSISVLNQSVLLKGVNDCADTLADLSWRLFDLDVMPYYLHKLDAVQGAAHFDCANSRARDIVSALQAKLPGYLCPRWVQEVPMAANKVPLTV